MHYASVWHVFPQPPRRSGGDYIRRELRDNKEDIRLMIIFRRLRSRLQRVIQNYNLYSGIGITVDYKG